MLINLIDARRGLHEKCVELFADKNIAEQIYRNLCEGIDDCEIVAEKTGKWIPVLERLPKEDTEVLVCYRHREGEGDTNHTRIDITSYGDMYFGGNRIAQTKHWREPFDYFALNYEVVAWQPLPEPFDCGVRTVD